LTSKGAVPSDPDAAFVSFVKRGATELLDILVDRKLLDLDGLSQDPQLLGWFFQFPQHGGRSDPYGKVLEILANKVLPLDTILNSMRGCAIVADTKELQAHHWPRSNNSDLTELAVQYKSQELVGFLIKHDKLTPSARVLDLMIANIHFPTVHAKALWKILAEKCLALLTPEEKMAKLSQVVAAESNPYMTAVLSSIISIAGSSSATAALGNVREELMVDDIVILSPGQRNKVVSRVNFKVL